jgi:hypothetical protein
VVVVAVLALVWAVVLVPPAVQAHRERQQAFLVSFGGVEAPPRPQSLRIQRRRRVAGGLLVATVATLLVGLLPTFRVLLVVHLFVLDSFLGYVAVLAHLANRAARVTPPVPEVAPALRGVPPRVAIAPTG